MKKILGLIVVAVILTGCATTKVERVDAQTATDLSGNWNDGDVRQIADTLVTECVNAPAITNFIVDKKQLPTVILGAFRNQSDEHLDTSIVAKKFEIALVNSGKVNFVAGGKDKQLLRDEREDQLENASEETAKGLGHEIGADFMLVGSIKVIVDQIEAKAVRNYIVNAELIDVESNRKLWVGENADIKKVIQRSKVRF